MDEGTRKRKQKTKMKTKKTKTTFEMDSCFSPEDHTCRSPDCLCDQVPADLLLPVQVDSPADITLSQSDSLVFVS